MCLDIKEIITVDEVMEEFGMGPNGGLVYCLEFLLENNEWLLEDLGEYNDEFLIVDCPGQIELYTHYDVMKQILNLFEQKDYRVMTCYLLESQFMQDVSKYFAGVLNATSAMMKMAVPHLNIVSKMDLIEGTVSDTGEHLGEDDEDIADELHPLHRFFFPDPSLLAERLSAETKPKFYRLNQALVQLIDEFDMVNFIPLNLKKESSLVNMLSHIDNATQYSEGLEPKEPKEFADEEDEDGEGYESTFGNYEDAFVDHGFEDQD